MEYRFKLLIAITTAVTVALLTAYVLKQYTGMDPWGRGYVVGSLFQLLYWVILRWFPVNGAGRNDT